METLKFNNFTCTYGIKVGLSEEQQDNILGYIIDRVYDRAIERKGFMLKQSFGINVSLRNFKENEKVKEYNYDKKTMKKIILKPVICSKFEEFDFIPEQKHLEQCQNALNKGKVKYE